MRLSMEAAKAAAASAAEAQKRAEEEAAQAAKERADMAAELDTTKAEVTRLQVGAWGTRVILHRSTVPVTPCARLSSTLNP